MLVGAAIRETFEETGVLLTSPAAQLAHLQPDVEQGRLPFGRLLDDHGLALAADLVRGWARWVTPPGGPRRYDTRFFVAALPAGATAADLTSESTGAEWVRPDNALADFAAARRRLMPPTRAILHSVAAFARVTEVLAAAASRSLAPVRPIPSRADDGTASVELPDGTRMVL
ncbi:MAG: NUDIX domain-containing protein [Actinobacteria bacterium]|nr:NUDIX domain-containing protein [Actinomycetota bacterium]